MRLCRHLDFALTLGDSSTTIIETDDNPSNPSQPSSDEPVQDVAQTAVLDPGHEGLKELNVCVNTLCTSCTPEVVARPIAQPVIH